MKINSFDINKFLADYQQKVANDLTRRAEAGTYDPFYDVSNFGASPSREEQKGSGSGVSNRLTKELLKKGYDYLKPASEATQLAYNTPALTAELAAYNAPAMAASYGSMPAFGQFLESLAPQAGEGVATGLAGETIRSTAMQSGAKTAASAPVGFDPISLAITLAPTIGEYYQEKRRAKPDQLARDAYLPELKKIGLLTGDKNDYFLNLGDNKINMEDWNTYGYSPQNERAARVQEQLKQYTDPYAPNYAPKKYGLSEQYGNSLLSGQLANALTSTYQDDNLLNQAVKEMQGKLYDNINYVTPDQLANDPAAKRFYDMQYGELILPEGTNIDEYNKLSGDALRKFWEEDSAKEHKGKLKTLYVDVAPKNPFGGT